jgi:diguanylate cyclase (GGDEF)-like protein
MGSMAFEVDDVEHAGSSRPGVSGAVVQALVAFVRAEAGDSGLAQALDLASQDRSIDVHGDTHRWTPLKDAIALFDAAGLVTGDDSVSLHVGQELLWVGDGSVLASRIRTLDSLEDAFRHVGAVVSHFTGATDAVALEVEPGRALVQVAPLEGDHRHAHECELTRGLLGEMPALFVLEPGQVTEHGCAARGGQVCRYEISWSVADRPIVGHGTGDPARRDAKVRPDSATERADRMTGPTQVLGNGDDAVRANRFGREIGNGSSPGRHAGDDAEVDISVPGSTTAEDSPVVDDPMAQQEAESLAEELSAARAALIDATAEAARWEAEATRGLADRESASTRHRAEAESEAARARLDVERLEQLLEGTGATTLDLLELDMDSLLSELATRADLVIPADRFLLMIRVGAGMPIELHHRGLGDTEARTLAPQLWGADADDASGRRVVDIASPRRRYGRLAVFVDPKTVQPDADERVLRSFAQYAANVLDVFTVLADARRSDTTARTILSFSEQLSGLTNLAQALQILADTVPEVTGCGQSTVYLWDQETSRLVLGAFTAGLSAPDADLGPIEPQRAVPTSAMQFQADLPDEDAAVAGGPGGDGADNAATEDGGVDHGDVPLSVKIENPLFQQMINDRQVIVLDATTVSDPLLVHLMESSGIPASVVAPMFAAGKFLGVIAANFTKETVPTSIHDPDLHERLSGLADQAATAIQNLELLEKVSHMAWHDALTGLPNRRLFEDRVEQELVRSRRVGEPVCMFFVDLDNFKTVNDTYGHASGDALIEQVAHRLVETVRSQDTVARVGGDEFAILLPGLVDQLSINQLAERTLDAVHTPFDIFGEEIVTSASVGIAIAPEHGDTYDDLLNRADEAMYRAKDHGRDAFEMFRHTPDPANPGRRAIDDRRLHADLISALDGNQFFLVYQPYIDLRTAEIVGVEALIRWRHPTLGVLEPPQFIPMAERSDLIVALDNWVLWQACRQLRAWKDHGVGPLRLSVNLASRDLSSPEFFNSVERTLTDTGIDPALLELEITERVVIDKTGPAVENIDRLRKLGVRFTIDNFGSGNSSLDRIGTFPVTTLKIDQSFVQVLGPEDEENSLVTAIIAMANKLGLSCVAEGVETLLQSRVLLERGCTTAQGSYFSPPLPPEGIEAMLSTPAPAEVPDSFGEPPNGTTPPSTPGG